MWKRRLVAALSFVVLQQGCGSTPASPRAGAPAATARGESAVVRQETGTSHAMTGDTEQRQAESASGPLVAGEIAELESVVARSSLGLAFPHCHERVVLGRWLGRVQLRHPPKTEAELNQLEPIVHREPELLPRFIEHYAKMTYDVWRELHIQHLLQDRRDPSRVRTLLAQRRRVEPKLIAYLELASRPFQRSWQLFRYELALHQLMLGDRAAARAAAEPLLAEEVHNANQAALLVAMSHLAVPVGEANLVVARGYLQRAALKGDRSLHAAVARCFTAEVLLALELEEPALSEFRKLRDAKDPWGVWRVAERRLTELDAVSADPR